MEKEIVVKVTRLRHSLAAETEDVKSPSTPSKKRGGKLATKPQLELIHENATEENEPKKTRKSIARAIEPEEKSVTPSRRSTRIRSNTSNVSETPTEAENKGTPSRRSTRVRSNTSLIAESAQFEHSPRAQRAARRTSFAGSDNESTITPVKQTRRTRKDSTSSVDKKADSNVSKLGIQPNLVIIVEKIDKGENDTKDGEAPSKDISESPSIRRSPRLVDKNGKNSLSQDGHNKENEPECVKTDDSSNLAVTTVETTAVQTEQNVVNEVNNLSKSSSNFSNDLKNKSKKKNTTLNNSTSALDKPMAESKRQRTKSWTTISSSNTTDHCFLSDTEVMKQKTKMKSTAYNLSNSSGSGDGLLNTSKNKFDKEDSLNLSATSKKSKNRNKKSITSSNTDVVKLVNSTSELNQPSSETENKQDDRVILGRSPKCLHKSIVFLEDSDSNASTTGKVNINYEANTEDQCVPVVKHKLEVVESQSNLSYEPMDIDETVTENTSQSIFINNNPVEEIQNNSVLLNSSYDNNSKKVNRLSSKTSDLKDDKDSSFNNSKKMSNKDMTSDDNESMNKSKRKSEVVKTPTNTNETQSHSNSATVIDNSDMSKIFSNMDADHDMTMNTNNCDTAIFNQEHDFSNKVIKSNRKSSICDTSTDGIKLKKANRKSSNSTTNNIDDNSSIPSSGRVKADYRSDDDEHLRSRDDSKINEDTINISSNNFIKGSSLENVHTDIMTPNNNSSKRDSISIDMKNDKNSDVAENETTMTDVINKHESKNKSFKKNKKNSIISDKDSDNTNESINISSRKSSISHMQSQSLDKSNSENKSTLVLSQIKDTSEINVEINEPLSKSLDIPNVKTDIDRKNLSLAYSTSTPLQQKSLKNLAIQFNSSDITSSDELRKNITDKKHISTKQNKESTVLQNRKQSQSSSEDDVEEDSDEEEAEGKSMFIDAEAEDVSDNYESGDSRDEDEKEYEEQNEIVDEGESLDSEEDDFSDDSEYDKDSFVVDSDEEDNNLLSGSGDDLSTNAEELDMSAKSKKKFNERKIKEQKKASREMFNARHDLEESNNSTSDNKKPKKVNHRRLDSSDSDIEKEKNLQPKRSKRARIDSSQEISMTNPDADNSVKKKKSRHLSESVCEDNAVENEISINQSIGPKNIDPLSLQNFIKQEPNTPQNDLNISTVVIKKGEEFEKVEIDENVSLIKTKSNLSLDPLQNTIAQDNATDSDESISENEEISKGYESVLNNLNSIKVKTIDISLSLQIKAKPKSKERIVDELNLTQAKSINIKSKLSDDQEHVQNITKNTSKIMANIDNSTNQEEDTSDSIDMKLLFNEDSSDIENKISVEVPDSYIPLKRSEGKMNILESGGEETETVSFFIDTKGTHTDNTKDENKEDASFKESAKKNKKPSTSFVDTEEVKDTEPELNIILDSDKKKKKKLSLSLDEQETAEPELNTIIGSDKKKKKLSISLDEQEAGEPELNAIIGSDKKKKKKLSLALDGEETAEPELNIIIDSDKKKKKKISLSLDEQETVSGEPELNIDVTGSNKKKKKKLSLSFAEQQAEEAPVNTSIASSHKKKKNKLSLSVDENEIGEQVIDNAPVSSVKKQKHKTSEEIVEHESKIDNKVLNINDGSNKKKKNKIASSFEELEIGAEKPPASSTKKQKQKNTKNLVEPEKAVEDNEMIINEEVTTKKRKRKRSANQSICQEAIQNSDILELPNLAVVATNDKKKRKFSHKEVNIDTHEVQVDNHTKLSDKKDKKKNKSEDDQLAADTTKTNKKRKHSEVDDNVSKDIKNDPSDKALVPRLPAKIINQLIDKPTKDNHNNLPKDTFVSTTSFKVEKTKKKKLKPSNYLEQSVYLNDSIEEETKKSSLLLPKVWPSVPTVSLSNQGFTTNFKVDVIPQDSQFIFVGQSKDIPNFKQDSLHKNRIKQLGTMEMYKRRRNVKLSKF